MNGNVVVILMATYNGAAFLEKQLKSIMSQSYSDWVLYVRDDLSTDETLNILKSFASDDQRINVVDLPGSHGSPALNFGALFNHIAPTRPHYLMFADQDDVWYPHKIERSLNFMQTLELGTGLQTPLSVYSSFDYIDEQDSIIKQELKMPESQNLPMLLVANYAYGCTMLINGALIQKINSLSDEIEYHDYWISLTAVTFGKSVHFNEKTLKYRQHRQNASTNVDNRSFSSRFRRYVENPTERLEVLVRQHLMLRFFLRTYENQLKSGDKELIMRYFSGLRHGGVQLIWFMISNGVKKIGFAQTLAHLYALARLRAKVVSAL